MTNLPLIYGLIGLFIVLGLFCLLCWIYFKFKKLFESLDGTIEKVFHFTNSDPLTGLANRALFFEHFKNSITKAKLKQQKVGLLFMDIDNFRSIKDSFGYPVAEALLKAVANRLTIVMDNKMGSLAHLGSDQFTIIIENVDDQKEICNIVEKLLDLLAKAYSLQDHEINTTVSIGISIYPDDGDNAESLLKSSAIARYHAKQMGSNTYRFYTQEMNAKLSERRAIEFHLRKAISKKEFVVFYQPKINVNTGRIVGAEALLQWNNPELGKISPSQFIPLAEEIGIIVTIGNWVLKEACQKTKQWNDNGFSGFSIAVNLSAYQFKTGDITEQITNVIWETGLDPALLELELTESLAMENTEKSLLMLRVLKTMGVQISLDDFGTGYSSLSQLRKLPVDSLKIDQSFVKNIHPENKALDDRAIITTIIAMAKQLGLKVVAEGVETEQQLKFLKEQGCDLIQGYLLGRPIPAEDFTKLLTQNWAEHTE